MKIFPYLSYRREINETDVNNICNLQKVWDSLNWKDASVTNVDIFAKKQFSLQFFYSLLQVYIV